MMRRFLMVAAAVLMMPAAVVYAGEDTGDALTGTTSETESVSGNASVSSNNTTLIPGVGELTDEEIGDLGIFTQELIESYRENQAEMPVFIEREPDTELSFDPATRHFRYTFPDGQWIESNIPQGAYYRGTVDFSTSEGVSALNTYHDGTVYAGKAPYQELGSYVVTFWDLNVGGDADKAYRLDYAFTIYSDYRMNRSMINAPGGMAIAEITYNGKPQAVSNPYSALLVEDGDYSFTFIGGGGLYEMAFTRDTVPPVLTIDPEYGYKGTMTKNPVWNAQEPETTVTIRRNYVDVDLPYGSIPVNGYYELTATDTAGNRRIYAFTVQAPLPFFSRQMLIVPAILLAAVIIIMINSRRNMQVR